jgi:RNA polymerase sigma-70 factor (ECF subfamily)
MSAGLALRPPSCEKLASTSSSAALEPERKYLWGVCYRMTGSAADADDLVQETFVRALERPPEDTSQPWRPWLVRVAMNLSRDQLRRRRRRSYPGMWLPTPIDGTEALADDAGDVSANEESPEARYGLMESASFAFLVAVEALSPSQRAVLILRDVFDYSSREAADMLGKSEEGIRTTLHRARKVMASYDRDKRPFGPDTIAAVESTLQEILTCIATGAAERGRALMTDRTCSLTDGGGLPAARGPVYGAEKVLKIYMKLATRSSPNVSFEIRRVNGLPALVAEDPAPNRPNAPRVVLLIDLARDGKIRSLFSVVAPGKLGSMHWPRLGPA